MLMIYKLPTATFVSGIDKLLYSAIKTLCLELVSIRDHVLRLPSDFCPFDIVALIEYVCTS